MKNLRVLVSLLLAVAMLVCMTSALAEFSVDTISVKIWDNNQLAGLQAIADE